MTTLHWIEDGHTEFPPSSSALSDPNGLLAAGRTLNMPLLLSAYQRGIFPWYEEGQPVLWWTPDPRLVIYPDELHVSKSLAKLLRQERFSVTTDRQFSAVISACAEPRARQSGTWISDEIKRAYLQLHHLGYAHSVEVWQEERLVGGLYGVAMGSVFFGESMFSRVSNASKIGFVTLVSELKKLDYQLIDCQVHTNHLESLGAREISRTQFEQHLIDYGVSAERDGRWPESMTGPGH